MAIRVGVQRAASTIAGRRAADDDRQDLADHAAAASATSSGIAVDRRASRTSRTPTGSAASTRTRRTSSPTWRSIPRAGCASIRKFDAAGGSEEGLARRPHRRRRRRRSGEAVRLEDRRPRAAAGRDLPAAGPAARGSSTSTASTTSPEKGVDKSQFFFHYDYLERDDPDQNYGHDQVGWYVIKVADPAQSEALAQKLDAMFANSPAETKTATEKAFVAGFAKQIGDIGQIMVAIADGGAVHDPARRRQHDGAGDARADQRAGGAEDARLQRRADPGAGAGRILPDRASSAAGSGSALAWFVDLVRRRSRPTA